MVASSDQEDANGLSPSTSRPIGIDSAPSGRATFSVDAWEVMTIWIVFNAVDQAGGC
jgi:hypothetical protein